MAFLHSRPTSVWFNAIDLSAYLRDAGVQASTATADTSTFQSTWASALPGLSSATLSFAGLYDPTVTVMADNLAVDSGVLTFCPGAGATIGDRARLVAVTATSYNESAAVGDVVAVAWDVMAEAAIAFGDVLHPLGEDTNTTTGAAKDETGQSALGWTAHSHIVAVDGGSWVVTVQDSADGSTGWATIATFAAKTAAGSERLLSATATTVVKQWVRYVATRTGGTAGDGLTFALAFARSRA